MKVNSLTINLGAIVLAFVTAFVIDPLDPSTLSTPFCLGLILMGLSFRESPRVICIMSVLFCILAVYVMIHFIESRPHPPLHPLFWFFQRFGQFVVVCLLSFYLSYYRASTEQSLAQIHEVLSKLPVPVVISNGEGYITYVNKALCDFCGKAATDLNGQRYIDLFMDQTHEGKAMRYYIELFEDQSNAVHRVELRGSSSPDTLVIAMGAGPNRIMISVVQSTEKALAKAISSPVV